MRHLALTAAGLLFLGTTVVLADDDGRYVQTNLLSNTSVVNSKSPRFPAAESLGCRQCAEQPALGFRQQCRRVDAL
jgi:hypothetical protein